jgi:hypothetical protein
MMIPHAKQMVLLNGSPLSDRWIGRQLHDGSAAGERHGRMERLNRNVIVPSASSHKWEAYRWLQKGLDARRE